MFALMGGLECKSIETNIQESIWCSFLSVIFLEKIEVYYETYISNIIIYRSLFLL